MMKKIVVILGGGISGLVSAWEAQKRFPNHEITLLEASSRVGGWIETVERDGFLFELGPRSCRSYGTGVNTLRLVEELGLADQVINAAPSARKRFLYTQQRLQLVPTNPLSFLTSSLTRPLLGPLLREWRVPPSTASDESIFDFIVRRLGRHAADTLIDPMVSGIFAGDPRQLSVKSCFPFLHRWEQEKGSILRGLFSGRRSSGVAMSPFVKRIVKGGLFSLRGGMQQLTDALEARLRPCICKGSPVVALDRLSQGMVVRTANGEDVEAEQVISALPMHQMAELVMSHDVELARLLQHMQYASVAVVCFGFRDQPLRRDGFGYLIPSKECERVLGVVWDSSVFPQQNRNATETRLTCMIGSARMQNFHSFGEQDFIAVAKEALARHLGIDAEPDSTVVKIATRAIPQYAVGHSERVESIRRRMGLLFPCLTLSGNNYDGVSVNDCIANAQSFPWTANIGCHVGLCV